MHLDAFCPSAEQAAANAERFRAQGMVVTVHYCGGTEWIVCGRAKSAPTPDESARNQTAPDVELATWAWGPGQGKRQVTA